VLIGTPGIQASSAANLPQNKSGKETAQDFTANTADYGLLLTP